MIIVLKTNMFDIAYTLNAIMSKLKFLYKEIIITLRNLSLKR